VIVDLILLAILSIAVVSGFKNGLIPSLFSLVGYLGGGIAGLLIAKQIASESRGFATTILLLIVTIFVGAQIGQRVAKGIGKGVRSFLGPLKIFDGLLGAIFTLIRALVVIYFLVSVISLAKWDMGLEAIEDSRIVKEITQRAPGSLSNLFVEVKDLVSD